MDSSSIRINTDDPILSILGSGSSFGSRSSSRLRMISKESSNMSMSAPCNYYRDVSPAGGVPFLWESIPGTPKHPSLIFGLDSDPNLLPPLTPPPSYFQKPPPNLIRYKPVVPRSSLSRFNLLRHMLRGIRLRAGGGGSSSSSSTRSHLKKNHSASPCSSSVSFSPTCSSSLSSWSTTTSVDGGRGGVSSGGGEVEEVANQHGGGRRSSSSLKCWSRYCFVLQGRNNSWRRRSGPRLIEYS